jgi:hypothetical protein
MFEYIDGERLIERAIGKGQATSVPLNECDRLHCIIRKQCRWIDADHQTHMAGVPGGELCVTATAIEHDICWSQVEQASQRPIAHPRSEQRRRKVTIIEFVREFFFFADIL